MKKFVYASAVLSSVLTGISCDNNDNTTPTTIIDTEKPEIVINTPTAHQVIEPGTQLSINALLTDNNALASYKIEIHSAEDGHEHRQPFTETTTPVEFHFEQVYQLSNSSKEAIISHNITIPTNAKQEHYHVGIFVIDKAGNQNQKFIEVYIGEEENHVH